MKTQRLLHQGLGVVFVVLLITAGLMHSESLRGTISESRFFLRGVHELSGALFVAMFLANAPYCWAFRQGKDDGLNRRGYLAVLLVACLGLCISGGGLFALLLLGRTEPASSSLYEAHILVAGGSVLVALPHLILAIVSRWRQPRGREETAGAGADSSRRGFLRYIAGGLLFGGIVVAWRWLGQQAATVKTETLDIFAQCNKMLPAPKPLPDSFPPIGGGYTGKFKVYKIAPEIPCSNTESWQFSVSGLVEKPQVFRWEEFLKIPRVVQVSDFHCVEGWSVYAITYEGVRMADLLDRVGVKPQAKYVKFLSAEGIYTDALSLEQARMPDVMAAVLLDGGVIPSDLGGPVRLVVPQMFAYKAVKWLVGIELVEAPHKGYWEARGYQVDAWVKPPPR